MPDEGILKGHARIDSFTQLKLKERVLLHALLDVVQQERAMA
jgi:hypothetical protein